MIKILEILSKVLTVIFGLLAGITFWFMGKFLVFWIIRILTP